jgi:hypothetical protein
MLSPFAVDEGELEGLSFSRGQHGLTLPSIAPPTRMNTVPPSAMPKQGCSLLVRLAASRRCRIYSPDPRSQVFGLRSGVRRKDLTRRIHLGHGG